MAMMCLGAMILDLRHHRRHQVARAVPVVTAAVDANSLGAVVVGWHQSVKHAFYSLLDRFRNTSTKTTQ